MPLASPLLDSRLAGVVPDFSGKVRDIVDLGETLLLIATDRISAFDYVLGSGIPDKGKVLTQLSAFWFERTHDIIPNHVLTLDVSALPQELRQDQAMLAGRSMVVRKTRPIPLECVARGYLSGSAWKEYVASGMVCGVPLPPGLTESDRLPMSTQTAGETRWVEVKPLDVVRDPRMPQRRLIAVSSTPRQRPSSHISGRVRRDRPRWESGRGFT